MTDETWVVNGHQLEVENSYTHLWNTFATKLLIDKSLEHVIVKAKVSALWQIGCTDIQLLFCLFDPSSTGFSLCLRSMGD